MSARSSQARARSVALWVLAPLVAGCLSPERQLTSIWPPEDFSVDVRHQLLTPEGLREKLRVQFAVDGSVFFRQATQWVGATDERPALPVFGAACRYRMPANSVRQFSRLLERAGLFELSAPLTTDQGAGPDLVSIRWRAFGNVRSVLLRGKVYGPAMRVVRVTNAFLPRGHEIILTEMTGETEEPHLLAVPQPGSLDDSLAHHETELAARDDDPELLADTIAVALAAGRLQRAAELLAELEEREAADARAQRVFPQEGAEGVATQLRAVLDDLRGD